MDQQQWVNRSRVKRWRQCLYAEGLKRGWEWATLDPPEPMQAYLNYVFKETLKNLNLEGVYKAFTHAHPLFKVEFTRGFVDGL